MKSYTLEKLTAAREAIRQEDLPTASRILDELIEKQTLIVSAFEDCTEDYEKQQENGCQRCGKCCDNVGTIFVHSKHPVIKAFGASLTLPDVEGYFRDDNNCPMHITSKGKSICLIQKHLGRKWKPETCRDYPFDGEPCFREQQENKDGKVQEETNSD